MKGYFSQLAQSTGLNFEPGGRTAPGSSATAPTVSSPPESRAEMAPPHIESVTLSTTSPLTAPEVFEETHDKVAAITQPGAIVSMIDEGAAVNRPVDDSDTTAYDASRSQRKNEPAPIDSSEIYPRFTFEEFHTRISNSEPIASEPRSSIAQERSSTGRQGTIQFSEGSLNQAQNSSADSAPGITTDTSIEISPLNSPEESDIRVRYSDAKTSLARASFAVEPSPANKQETVEFSEASSPAARGSAATELLQRVEELEDQSAASANRADAQDHLLEAMVRDYLKEVRAWTAATPAIDGRTPEQDEWAQALREHRDVLTFGQESGAASSARDDRAEEPEVQDVSLSIGNISIVIEEPKKDAPAPTAVTPAAERSHERTGREPASLSRYYLRTW